MASFEQNFKWAIERELKKKKPLKHIDFDPKLVGLTADTAMKRINEMGHSCTVNNKGIITVDVY